MIHRNVILFEGTEGRRLELLAEGTMWPKEVHVDGEAWLMGDVVEGGPGFAVREYVLSERLSPGQRFLKAVGRGS